jgi:hypothetical protein
MPKVKLLAALQQLATGILILIDKGVTRVNLRASSRPPLRKKPGIVAVVELGVEVTMLHIVGLTC